MAYSILFCYKIFLNQIIMKANYITYKIFLFGLLLGSNVALYIPKYHAQEFIREVPVLGFQIWEYNLWGIVFCVIVNLIILYIYGKKNSLLYCLWYIISFSFIVYSSDKEYSCLFHSTIFNSIFGFGSLFIVLSISGYVEKILCGKSVTIKRCKSWALPTRIGLILGIIGLFGSIVTFLAWVDVPSYTLIPGLEKRKGDILRVPYKGNVIELLGNDGKSMSNAIRIIVPKGSEDGGVYSEYYWMHNYYPHLFRTKQNMIIIPSHTYTIPIVTKYRDRVEHSQSSQIVPSHCYDEIILENWFGLKTTIYFQIDNFVPCDEAPDKYSVLAGMEMKLEYKIGKFLP